MRSWMLIASRSLTGRWTISQKRSLTSWKRPVVSTWVMPTTAWVKIARKSCSRWRSRDSTRLRIATSALSARLGTAMLITNTISSRKDSLSVAPANGPPPSSVPQTAKHDRMSTTIAVSRGPHRNAAQINGRIARKPSDVRCTVCSNSGLKAITPTTQALACASNDFRTALSLNGRYVAVAHSTTTGVTTSALVTLPSHQVNQIAAKFAHSASPARIRLPTPMVALSIVPGTSAISANFATPLGVSKVRCPSDHRVVRYPLTAASSVLPIAIVADVTSRLVDVALATSVVALAAKDPSKIAGHIRIPPTRMNPRARPVAGQIGVALGWIDANARPALASTKYTATSAASVTLYLASRRTAPKSDSVLRSETSVIAPPMTQSEARKITRRTRPL